MSDGPWGVQDPSLDVQPEGVRRVVMSDVLFDEWISYLPVRDGVEYEVDWRRPLTEEVTYWSPIITRKERKS